MFTKKDINAGVAECASREGAVLIDVRDEEEFRAGHIPGAVNVPLGRIALVEDAADDFDTPIYLYCLSGVRSARAAAVLGAMGYTDVTSIGGIASYKGEIER